MAQRPTVLGSLIDSLLGAVADYAAALDVTNDVRTWYEAMKREIVRSHIQATIAGRGGMLRTRVTDWARVTRQIREEFRYLRQFAVDIVEKNLSTAQIAARSALYSNHAQVSFWSAKDAGQKAQGFTQERRVLGAAEHCADCVGYASQGWVPIGSLPAPGDGSVCRANCQCTKEYR